MPSITVVVYAITIIICTGGRCGLASKSATAIFAYPCAIVTTCTGATFAGNGYVRLIGRAITIGIKAITNNIQIDGRSW
jgi:hypothetical protein